MAEQLGVATLEIGVNTQGALVALENFRKKAEEILSSTNTKAFSNLAKDAEVAGKQAGEKVADGIKKAVSGLKFENISEALSFGGALNGTIADLKTYKNALLELRNTTKTTTPGFNELNAQIEATDAAIKSLSISTDNLGELLRQSDAKQFADDIKAFAAALRQGDAEIRATSSAITAAERSLSAYDKASRESTRIIESQIAAARELRDAYLGVAGAAVKAAAGAVGTAVNVGKGAVSTGGKVVKGAIDLGKAGYDIGAGLGIFDKPGTGPFGEKIKAVSDRFKLIAEQAQTTRGVLLRVFEGLGTGAGLLELVKNADLLKSILNNLGGTAEVAKQGLNGLAGTTNFLAKAFNSLEGDWAGLKAPSDSLLGNLVNLTDGAAQATAGAGSLAESFARFGVELGGGAIDTLVNLSSLLGQVPIEAAAVSAAVAAALAVFGGGLQKQAASGIGELINKIENLGRKALEVRADLQGFYEGLLAKPQLALPSTEQLQPERNGIKRLDPQTNSLINAVNETLALRKAEQDAREEAVRLSDALDTNRNIGELLPNAIERGARWFQKQAEHAQRVAEYSQNTASNQLKPALSGESSQIPIPTTQYSTFVGPAVPPPIRKDAATAAREEEQSAERIRELHALAAEEVRKRRVALQQAAAAAKQEAEQISIQRQQRAADYVEQQRQQAKQERQARQESSDRFTRPLKNAAGSGLIGGAFPALFGQGVAASIGGGVGGVAGGLLGGQFGFGLSLVGTQFGQFIDDAIKKTATLADALRDPIASFEQLRQASLLSSKGLENNIDSLIKAGREEEAAALIRGDIAKQFGNGNEFKALQSAYDEVGRSLTRLGVSIADGLAPALTSAAQGLIKFIDALSLLSVKQAGADIQQAKAFIGKDPSRQAEFDTIYKGMGGKYGSNGKFAEGYWKVAAEASRELLNNNNQLTQQQQAQATQDKATSDAKQRYLDLQKVEKGLIESNVAKDKEQTYTLEKRKLALEEIKALNLAVSDDGGIAKETIRNDYILKRLKLEREYTAELAQQRIADLTSANRISSLQTQANINRLSPNLSGSGLSALQAGASLQEAIRAQQVARAGFNATPADPAALRALNEASATLNNATANARTQLVQAFRSAKKEAFDASNALQSAYLNLLQLRTGNSGLNKFLTPTAQAERDRQTNSDLKPLFYKALFEAGPNNVSRAAFAGDIATQNQKMIEFINAVQQEKNARNNLSLTQDAYVQAQNSLQVATEQLTSVLPSVQQSALDVATAIQSLVEKEWNVGVTVNRDTGSVDVANAYAR